MPKKRGSGQYGRPRFNQSSKIIAKFGGEAALAAAVRRADPSSKLSRVTCFRWGYARPYGTDGLIPSSAIDSVNKAARLEGIVLKAEDWLAERINYDEEAA